MSSLAGPFVSHRSPVQAMPAVIEDARRRQRKRRFCLAIAGVILVTIGSAIYGSLGGGANHAALGAAVTRNLPGASASASRPTLTEMEAALTCPTCHGVPLTRSRRPVALQMDTMIRIQIAAGWTKNRILHAFALQVGPKVLLHRPKPHR
jgi:hypothetical protein